VGLVFHGFISFEATKDCEIVKSPFQIFRLLLLCKAIFCINISYLQLKRRLFRSDEDKESFCN